jgi:hypothetical protein
VATYLHSYRMEQRAYVFALTTGFQVLAVAQIVARALFGLSTWRRLGMSVLSLLPVMAVLPLGARVSRRVSTRTFDLIVLAVLGPRR